MDNLFYTNLYYIDSKNINPTFTQFCKSRSVALARCVEMVKKIMSYKCDTGVCKRLHCKDFHCKNYRYSLCLFSHCSFNAFLTVIDCIQSITAIWIRCSQNLQSLQCNTCIFWILRSTFCALSASSFRGLYLNILHSNNCNFCNPIPAFFTSIKYSF